MLPSFLSHFRIVEPSSQQLKSPSPVISNQVAPEEHNEIKRALEVHERQINNTQLHPLLRRSALDEWMSLQQDECVAPIWLGVLNLSGINLHGIDFSDTILSRSNFDAIVAAGGSVLGATLDSNANITDLSLSNVVFDYAMAKSLVKAGVDIGVVTFRYLATPHHRASQLYKTELFKNYLANERKTSDTIIDLSNFDLSDIIFTDIDFKNTLLGDDNLEWLFAGRADLRGAELVDGARSPALHCFDFVRLDKKIALQLIRAGADPKAVFLNYRSSPSGVENTTDIDLDMNEFGVLKVHDESTGLAYIANQDPQGVVQTHADIMQQFEHEFLALLKTYAIAVRELVKHSATKDDAIKKTTHIDDRPDHVYQSRHHFKVIEHIQSAEAYSLWFAETLKFSAGDCGEMSGLGKMILDQFLSSSLFQLGWDVTWYSFEMGARSPSRHYVDAIGVVLKDETRGYLLDPWSEQAWRFEKGIEFFRENTRHGYTHSYTTFRKLSCNRLLNHPEFQAIMQKVFIEYGIEQHITQVLQRHKCDFK